MSITESFILVKQLLTNEENTSLTQEEIERELQELYRKYSTKDLTTILYHLYNEIREAYESKLAMVSSILSEKEERQEPENEELRCVFEEEILFQVLPVHTFIGLSKYLAKDSLYEQLNDIRKLKYSFIFEDAYDVKMNPHVNTPLTFRGIENRIGCYDIKSIESLFFRLLIMCQNALYSNNVGSANYLYAALAKKEIMEYFSEKQ